MLGHPQRGGAPTPIDRIMGLMFGARAAEAVANGQFGKLVSARGIAPACDLSLVDSGRGPGQTETPSTWLATMIRSVTTLRTWE